jgi:hypothetical protein
MAPPPELETATLTLVTDEVSFFGNPLKVSGVPFWSSLRWFGTQHSCADQSHAHWDDSRVFATFRPQGSYRWLGTQHSWADPVASNLPSVSQTFPLTPMRPWSAIVHS